MKKLFIFFAGSVLALVIACNPLETTEPSKPVEVTTINYKAKHIEYITGELHTSGRSLGLYKITLQDGREVLLYNDARGIAMVQLTHN
jgi:hypothetical protein